MAHIYGYLRRFSSGAAKAYQRKILRTQGFVPFEMYSKQGGDYRDAVGIVWINKATLIGDGGSGFTVTDASTMFQLWQ